MNTAAPVGFVGVGNMGAPMARCLARAGFGVVLYDRLAATTAPFKAAGDRYQVAESLSQVGAACGTVITMLPDSRIVRAAALGDADAPGFAHTMEPGGLIIDMSSSFPLDTRALGEELLGRGIGLIDAPVSGGVPKAAAGTLAIMAGGETALIDRAASVLEAMGKIHRTGALGSGHAMKALNNYVSAAGLIATCEALIVGRKFGLDGKVMTDVLNASTGRNNTTENKAERYLLSGKYDSGFALALMDKDVGMAARLARALEQPCAELDFVSALLHEASEALGPDADHTAVMQHCDSNHALS